MTPRVRLFSHVSSSPQPSPLQTCLLACVVWCVCCVWLTVRPFAQGCPCGRARACGEPLHPVHRRIVVLIDNCSTSRSHRYRCRRACTCCRTGAECPLLHQCRHQRGCVRWGVGCGPHRWSSATVLRGQSGEGRPGGFTKELKAVVHVVPMSPLVRGAVVAVGVLCCQQLVFVVNARLLHGPCRWSSCGRSLARVSGKHCPLATQVWTWRRWAGL